MKIGIIQTRGLGDIVIAAPIAMYYIERGCEVYWPIDSDFVESFKYAFPKISFLSVDKKITGENSADYFLHYPQRILESINCDVKICLYSHLTGIEFNQGRLQNSVSFDSYKYAIANVPFREKWNLKIKRNPVRESRIFDLLNLDPSEKYAVIHDQGSVHKADLDELVPSTLKTIKLSQITNNFLDWISVLENADSLYLVNSVYSNLADQLNLKNEKFLYMHTEAQWTPVLINNWKYI